MDVGQPEVADQPGVTQLCEGAETLRERIPARSLHDPQIHHVEVVAAEAAEVLFDLASQLGSGGCLVEAGRGVIAGPDLGRDDEVVRVWRERSADQIGRVTDRAGSDVEGAARER
ncbi:hypothetical protein GCM10027610_030760 [Dactylosporangium cerinum]